MEPWVSSLIIGFSLGAVSVWLISLIHNRYIQREKEISLLFPKGIKED